MFGPEDKVDGLIADFNGRIQNLLILQKTKQQLWVYAQAEALMY